MLSPANIVMCIQFACTVALLVFLIRRKTYTELPIFFSYIVYAIAETVLQWSTYSNPHLYFKAYWVTEAIDVLLAVAAICESFISTFRGYLRVRWFPMIIPALAVTVAAYAILKAWFHPPVLNSPMAATVIGLEIGLRYFIAGIFVAYMLARRLARVTDLRFQNNIMLGFFLASCGMLLAAVLRSEFGTRYRITIAWAQPVAYSCALLVWIASSYTPLTDEKEKSGHPQMSADSAFNELEGYKSVLRKTRKLS